MAERRYYPIRTDSRGYLEVKRHVIRPDEVEMRDIAVETAPRLLMSLRPSHLIKLKLHHLRSRFGSEVNGETHSLNSPKCLAISLDKSELISALDTHDGTHDYTPMADIHAAETVNLTLRKVRALTGEPYVKKRPLSFQLRAAVSKNIQRKNTDEFSASSAYGRCLKDQEIFEDEDTEAKKEKRGKTPRIDPLRMHPVPIEEEDIYESEHSDECWTIPELPEPATDDEEEEEEEYEETHSIPAATTTISDDEDDITDDSYDNDWSDSTPESPEGTADTSSYGSLSPTATEPFYPIQELAAPKWPLGDEIDAAAPIGHLVSPYRMGSNRRYGWVEGQFI
ncbi:hypothetical protein FQN50_004316 [Emmonsiellopsis sp. PD_5]|nr:hypothetical protein FQN50_004316 [Emmonsiellopsis sp. PD_5]